MMIGPHNTDDNVIIVAEIGNNHEGNFSRAKEMIKLAASAGVHAVKFQTIVPEKLVSMEQTARLEQLRKFQFSIEQFKQLSDEADRCGVLFLTTPFDIQSAKAVDSFVKAFKIASGDNNFWPLLEVVAKTMKPMIVSTGLLDDEEVECLVSKINQIQTDCGNKAGMALLHCVVSYPTPLEEARLMRIAQLKKWGVTVGYSDHTLGIDAAVLSVAFGARIIEKHFTDDATRTSFRDHALSADPVMMKELVNRVKEVEKMAGFKLRHSPCELENRNHVRRSMVAGDDIKKGTLLDSEHITWVRVQGGIAPGAEAEILGGMTIKDIKKGQLIRPGDVEF